MGRKSRMAISSPPKESKSTSSSAEGLSASEPSLFPSPPVEGKKTVSSTVDDSLFDERRRVREEDYIRSMEKARSSDPTSLTKFPRLMEMDYRSCKTYALERESVLKAWKAAEVEMTDKQKVQSSHLASFDSSLLRSICKYDELLRHVVDPTNEDLEDWLQRQLETVEKDMVPSDLKAFSLRLKEYAGKAELRYGRRAFVTLSPILRGFDGAVEDFGRYALVEAKAKHVMEAW